MKTVIKAASIAAALFTMAATTPGMASVYSSDNVNAQVYSDGVTRYLKIRGNSTSMSFYVPSPRRVAVLFNAESSMKSSDNSTWYDIDLEVRNPAGALTILRPSNNDNAFTTSKGNNLLQNWESNETNGTYYASKAGWYRVRVKGTIRGYSAGEQVRIDDVSVIVVD